jgi:hypothetical protein
MERKGSKKGKNGLKKEMGQTFDITDLAKIFKVNEKTMRAYVTRLRIPVVEGIGKILVYEWELDQWFRENSRRRRRFARK